MTYCSGGIETNTTSSVFLVCDTILDNNSGFDGFNPENLPFIYKGDSKTNMGRESWIMKGDFDPSELDFVCSYEENSILIHNEIVESVYEFGSGQLLVFCNPTDFLVLQDWTVLHRVIEP